MKHRLEACPSSPNCVCSSATDPRHRIAPLVLAMEPSAAWTIVRAVVESWPRTRILEVDDQYLHAACTTRLVRFVDDLMLLLDVDRNEIAVRSASRVGYYDLGTNRHRVETLRRTLVGRGVVR